MPLTEKERERKSSFSRQVYIIQNTHMQYLNATNSPSLWCVLLYTYMCHQALQVYINTSLLYILCRMHRRKCEHIHNTVKDEEALSLSLSGAGASGLLFIDRQSRLRPSNYNKSEPQAYIQRDSAVV